MELLSWLTKSKRMFNLNPREVHPSPRSLQEQKEKVSPPKVAEAEEEEVEEDALVLLLGLPSFNRKMKSKNLSSQYPEEAAAKSLNYPLLRYTKRRRSH